MTTRGLFDKQGVGADRFEGAHWAVDASGNDLFGAIEKGGGATVKHGERPPVECQNAYVCSGVRVLCQLLLCCTAGSGGYGLCGKTAMSFICPETDFKSASMVNKSGKKCLTIESQMK